MFTDLLEPCGRCGGDMGIMGILGRRAHARCRGCGIEESEFILEDDELEHLAACLADDEVSGFWDLEDA